MPIQEQVWLGVGYRPQSDFQTPNTAAQMWGLQTDRDSPIKAEAGHETDQGETGTGVEWARQQFKTGFSMEAELPVKASVEWLTWALVMGLGASTPGGTPPPTVYTVTPKARTAGGNDQLTPFTVACQVGPIGNETAHHDEALIGCVVSGFDLSVRNGISRSDVTLTIRLVGTGKFATPSTITIPATLQPNFMPASSLELTSLGKDYVGDFLINSLDFSWENDPQMRYLGGGVQDGYALGNVIEFGKGRGYSLTANVDFTGPTDEIDKIRGQTEGSAVFALQQSADERVEITAESVRYAAAPFSLNERDKVSLDIEHRAFYDGTDGLLTAVCRTAQANIGVAA